MRRQKAPVTFTTDYDSGLKVWGVITSVRQQLSTSPDGRKQLRYLITGSDFGHFLETDVYYDPVLSGTDSSFDAFKFKEFVYRSLSGVGTNEWRSPTDNIKLLLNAYLGNTRQTQLATDGIINESPNQVFRIPKEVGQFFDNFGDQHNIASVLETQIGILQYSKTSPLPAEDPPKLLGTKFITIEPGQSYPLWSVLQQYSNSLLNEMYCDLKPTEVNGETVLRPTLVLRQMPYSSNEGSDYLATNYSLATTRFESLPRWTIPDSFILSEDSGKSEAMRYNYLHMTGFGLAQLGKQLTGLQTNLGNFAIDTSSISRHGLKTMVVHTDYDLVVGREEDHNAGEGRFTAIPEWIKIYADWFLNTHLQMTGSFQFIGIEEPISIGDNIQILRNDGRPHELYHIDSYGHDYSVSANGDKSFRTNVSCVRGRFLTSQTFENDSPEVTNDLGITSAVLEPEFAVTETTGAEISPKIENEGETP
jgi:hypothetical protein